MPNGLDITHDAGKCSFTTSANDTTTDLPIQNLALGIFRSSGKNLRLGVLVADHVFEIKPVNHLGVFPDEIPGGCASAMSSAEVI